MNIKLELNKWNIVFTANRDYSRMELGWKIFYFGVFKIIVLPKNGEYITKNNYKGFLIRFRFWVPFEKF